MNPWCSPGWVLGDYTGDQFPNLLRRRSSSNLLPNSGDQPPVHTKARKPVRCQRTTVSGVTRMRESFQADQTLRAVTKKSLSSRPSIGRGCRRFSVTSC
jgi:hypothetical protein